MSVQCKCGSRAINDDPHSVLCDNCWRDAEIERLRGALADAMVMATNGDYTNGVTDPSGCLDQGACWAGVILADLQSRCTELGVVFGPTIYDNRQRYDARAAGGDL